MLDWLKAIFPFLEGAGSEPDHTISSDAAERMRAYRQGDVLPGVLEIPVGGANGSSRLLTPNGVVIVSQTCDVVQNRSPFIHVAPRVTLSEENASAARAGRRIRYVNLPALGPNEFADIAETSLLHKQVVADTSRIAGIATQEEIGKFGRAVGRCFNRFAFPDSVSIFLGPLGEWIRDKSKKSSSPEGQCIGEVMQFRIQCLGQWDHPPFDLRLIVVVEPAGTLPVFPEDELPRFDEELQAWLYDRDGNVQRTPGVVAAKIVASRDPDERYWLWAGLGDAWAGRCKFGMDASPEHLAEVSGITSEVISADQFTLAMSLDSELMDLDDLSVSRTY